MEASPTPKRNYVTQFDALRFFAAFITAIYHADIVKFIFGAPDRPVERYWDYIGSHCVTFFFVLSGFLITWLLLREKDETSTIDVRAFYLRRIFRIWPLYYLILLLGLVIIPSTRMIVVPQMVYSGLANLTFGEVLLWLTFFPNLQKLNLISGQLLISHTWSIGMEEQFYLGWPWLVRQIRQPIWGVAALLALFALLRYVIYPLTQNHNLEIVVTFFRFDCMGIGGLLAWAYHTRPTASYFRILKSRFALYLLGAASLGFTFVIDYPREMYDTPPLAGMYGCFLLALAFQPARMTWLNHPVLRYLGQISYGIYMYNLLACMAAMTVVIHVLGGLESFSRVPVRTNLVYWTLSLGLTLLFAGVSYRFFEAPFLRLKARLAQPHRLNPAVEGLPSDSR